MLRLKEAGIAVLNERESQSVPNVPILHLNTYLECKRDGGSCGYHTNLELGQRVQLRRDQSIAVTAITWRNSYTGSINRAELSTLPSLLAADALSLVIGFLSDYLTANPK